METCWVAVQLWSSALPLPPSNFSSFLAPHQTLFFFSYSFFSPVQFFIILHFIYTYILPAGFALIASYWFCLGQVPFLLPTLFFFAFPLSLYLDLLGPPCMFVRCCSLDIVGVDLPPRNQEMDRRTMVQDKNIEVVGGWSCLARM